MRCNSIARALITFALLRRRMDQIFYYCLRQCAETFAGLLLYIPLRSHADDVSLTKFDCAAKSEFTTSARRIEIAISLQKLRHILTQDMTPENSHRATEALIFSPPNEEVIFSSVVVCLTRCVFIWPEMIAVTWWRHQMETFSALLTSL